MTGNAAWLLICRVAADLLNLLFFILVSRVFGPEGTGEYAYGFAIAGFVYATTTLGIEDYAIREYTRADAAHRSRLLHDVLGTQLCVALLALLGLALFVAITRPDAELMAIIVALTIYQFSCAFANTLFVPAMAEQHMMQPALSYLAGRGFSFVTAAVLIVIGKSALAPSLYAFAGGGVLLLALAARSAKAHGQVLGVHISKGTLQARTRALWSFASIDLLSQVLARISVIALTLIKGETAAGVYATGLKLIEAASLSLHFLGAAAYPRLCHSFHGGPADFARLQRVLLSISIAASLAIAAGMYWVVPMLLVPVFGPQYDGTQLVIASMAILAFAQSAEIMPGRILFAANLQVERAALVAGAAVLCALLNLPLVRQWGIEGATAATAGAYLVLCVLYARLLYSRTGNRQRSQSVLREPS
jgi:O-antigen/teichoic acid export membrane protein